MTNTDSYRQLALQAKEHADAATQGPWESRCHTHLESGCLCMSCSVVIGFTMRHQDDCDDVKTDTETVDRCMEAVFTSADALFVERARELVPQLADAVLALLPYKAAWDELRAAADINMVMLQAWAIMDELLAKHQGAPDA